MDKISAVIITKNEERNIERCILSLSGVVDEVLVADSFSTDETPLICERLKVNLYQTDWLGYAATKNEANKKAQHKFILSIDADEVLDEKLREAILIEKEKGLAFTYLMSRLTNYCGKFIYHSGWYPDIKPRLFNKEIAKWEGNSVHESLTYSSKDKLLDGHLLHYSYFTVNEHVERARKYASLAAEGLKGKALPILMIKLLINPLFRFIKTYFVKMGFLDGQRGLLICVITSYEVFNKYRLAISLKMSK